MKKSIIEAYEKLIGYNPDKEGWSEQEALQNLLEHKRIEREQYISLDSVESEFKRFSTIYKEEVNESFMKPELMQTGNESIGDFFFIRLSASGYLDCTDWVWLQNESDIGDWFLTYVDTY